MRSTTLTSAMMLVLTGSVWAADTAEDNIRQQLGQVDSRLQVKSVEPAPVAGLYEVVLSSGETLYADMKGEYLLAGQLFRVDTEQGLVNLTEEKRNLARQSAIESLDAADMVVYAPQGEVKATLHVFTDVDCPYCHKLHEEVPALNKMGVQVNYLAFPRGGPGSAAHNKMQTIWCATDDERRARMDAAKSGERLSAETCDNPVLDQYMLGQKLGVTGTPALILDDGTLLPGYMPAARLQQILKLN
ncbi:MAG: DsbC family protein [Oceanospirillales bacterium]|uniref:Thiol:disulfide interchange protein n=1 Tax=Marinobacterium halophilum TaxID=267374 RepID=A0A2P8ETB3_9GAMM|nr:DsbC family protein [Marinobacterium halophilum]MBR9827817.1 DsbC family protein [Oceanospirillales bacterium]PSL12694.1 thiol:disulfide interchange protein DsbC [Marinobacterium halophilum]